MFPERCSAAVRAGQSRLLGLVLLAGAALAQEPTPLVRLAGTGHWIDPEDGWDPRSTLFGLQVAAVGDVDRDGHEDLAISAPGAWTGGGRTGCVLVVSMDDGRVLRRFDGEGHDDFFGGWITALHAGRRGLPARLAITWGRNGANYDRLAFASVLDLDSGALVCVLPGIERVLGSPGDLDLDGTPDLLCQPASPTFDAPPVWHSGRDGAFLRALESAGPAELLADFDGDWLRDFVVRPDQEHSGADLRSSADGRVLARIEFDGPLQELAYEFSVIAADVDGDGSKEVVTSIPNRARTATELVAFCASEGRELQRVDLGWVPQQGYVPQLFASPDLDADRCEDVLAVSGHFPGGPVRALSGKDMRTAWRHDGLIQEGRMSLATFDAIPGGEPGRSFDTAVGSVLFLDSGIQYGEHGEVVLLERASGKLVKRIPEADYPELSFARFVGRAAASK